MCPLSIDPAADLVAALEFADRVMGNPPPAHEAHQMRSEWMVHRARATDAIRTLENQRRRLARAAPK